MVHRPSRLVDIIAFARARGLEAKVLRPVAPRKGETPNLVLIGFRKGGGKELKIEETLFVRDEERYSEEIEKIYDALEKGEGGKVFTSKTHQAKIKKGKLCVTTVS